MGGFLGIGNSSAKTDRGNQLAGINGEWNVYNRGLPLADQTQQTGTAQTASGFGGVDQAKQYWSNILSGNKPQVMQAASPAISAINDQSDAARTQQAETGTARGGGVAGANQNAETQRMQQTGDVIAGMQPAAAQGEQSAGTAEANIGNQQMQDALRALGLSADTAGEIINSSIQSRPISMKANAEVRQQWSNFLASMGL